MSDSSVTKIDDRKNQKSFGAKRSEQRRFRMQDETDLKKEERGELAADLRLAAAQIFTVSERLPKDRGGFLKALAIMVIDIADQIKSE